jgi:hypothetical protein
MGWLKKAGVIIGQVTAAVVGLGPVITTLTPTKKDDAALVVVQDTLNQLAGIVTQVEAMAAALSQPLPGSEKLKMATPMVAQVILASSLMARHKIANPALFQQGCASIGSGMADVLNSLKDDVDTIDKT